MIWHEFIGEISWKRESFKKFCLYSSKKKNLTNINFESESLKPLYQGFCGFIENSFTYQMVWKLKAYEIDMLQTFI